ncbi:MAG TPA: glycosyl hydrolase family 16, partial [Alteromonas sp.]|nr:glycosyl hydrolase family 16 [Alteromonas sp.]
MKNTTMQLSRLLAAMTAATLMGCGGESAKTESDFTTVDPAQPVADWQLVWSDDFDGSAIDSAKWTHEVNCVGGGNNEQQCYTDDPANSYVADGMLHIVALPAEEGAEKPYTSARLNTRYKGDFKYGRFEMRAKLPSGQGSWPAFWMLPTDYVYGGWPKSGEIDIMEA